MIDGGFLVDLVTEFADAVVAARDRTEMIDVVRSVDEYVDRVIKES